MRDYVDNHDLGKLAFYSREFKPLGVFRKDFAKLLASVEEPSCFPKMCRVAERLAEGFPHVRVDLYEISGEVKFGEMTFYSAGGYIQFLPDSFDITMGEKFNLRQYQ